jgi:uncharacterized protein
MATFTKAVHALPWQNQTIHTWCLDPAVPRPHAPTIVMMHGAGTSNSLRAQGMAEVFARSGMRVISLDFVGHGQTSGALQDVSLALRTQVARAVIDYWTQDTDKLILCGASMSGHTALRLTAELADRVVALNLFAPAIYAAEAEPVLFGDDFRRILRSERSWESSLALRDAQQFTGKVYIALSNHDEIIPWEAATQLFTAFKNQAREVRFSLLSEPDHKLAAWLSARPERCLDILRYALDDDTIGL